MAKNDNGNGNGNGSDNESSPPRPNLPGQVRASEARLQALQMKGQANVFWDLIKDLGKFQGVANDREAAEMVAKQFAELKAAHKKWQEAIKVT